MELDFKAYYRSLPKAARQDYARRAGTTESYIDVHLSRATKMPGPALIRKLAEASNGRLDEDELVLWFHKHNRQRNDD